jgi:hypothetical protein
MSEYRENFQLSKRAKYEIFWGQTQIRNPKVQTQTQKFLGISRFHFPPRQSLLSSLPEGFHPTRSTAALSFPSLPFFLLKLGFSKTFDSAVFRKNLYYNLVTYLFIYLFHTHIAYLIVTWESYKIKVQNIIWSKYICGMWYGEWWMVNLQFRVGLKHGVYWLISHVCLKVWENQWMNYFVNQGGVVQIYGPFLWKMNCSGCLL